MKKRTVQNKYTFPRFIRSLVRAIRELADPLTVAVNHLQPTRGQVLRDLQAADIVLMDLCLLGHQLAKEDRLGTQAEALYRDISTATADQLSASLTGLRDRGIKWIGKSRTNRLVLPGAHLLELYDAAYGTHHRYTAGALYFRFSSLLVKGDANDPADKSPGNKNISQDGPNRVEPGNPGDSIEDRLLQSIRDTFMVTRSTELRRNSAVARTVAIPPTVQPQAQPSDGGNGGNGPGKRPGDRPGERPGERPGSNQPPNDEPPEEEDPEERWRAEQAAADREIEKILAELNDMIGLETVRRDVGEMVAFLRIQKLRAIKGMATVPTSRHLVFYGNPGTGKTTVARMLAKIYKALGMLTRGHFVETDRGGMVAGYVGQTALKVQRVVQDALGGVLFIDEAYALSTYGSSNDFGGEAIATLIKMMEDHRENLVVIVAGYPDKMREFLRSNPGLESRFNKFILFEDYTAEELTEIFEYFCTAADYKVSRGAQRKLLLIFKDAYARRDDTFGNARYARNIFERAIYRQAGRILQLEDITDEALFTLEPEDIPENDYHR